MKIYLNNIILDFLGNISSDIYYYHKFGFKLFRTELIYFKNDKTYTFMIFTWAILIPLSMSYVNFSFFLNVFYIFEKINR
jgi:hypothetical protein